MKVRVCLTLDEDLLRQIDIAATRIGINRSAFIEIILKFMPIDTLEVKEPTIVLPEGQ
jgi:metal-responsive CopG/Arc/MetJ family transcriptional regulator